MSNQQCQSSEGKAQKAKLVDLERIRKDVASRWFFLYSVSEFSLWLWHCWMGDRKDICRVKTCGNYYFQRFGIGTTEKENQGSTWLTRILLEYMWV